MRNRAAVAADIVKHASLGTSLPPEATLGLVDASLALVASRLSGELHVDISPISRLYLPYISPISRLYLPGAGVPLLCGASLHCLRLEPNPNPDPNPTPNPNPNQVRRRWTRPSSRATRRWYAGDMGEI